MCGLCCVFYYWRTLLAAFWKMEISVLMLLAESIFLYFAEQKYNDNIFLQQSWSRRKNELNLQWGFSGYALVYLILLRTASWINTGWAACGFWVACTYRAIWVHFPRQGSTVAVLPREGQVRRRVGNLSPGGCWTEITPNPADVIS